MMSGMKQFRVLVLAVVLSGSAMSSEDRRPDLAAVFQPFPAFMGGQEGEPQWAFVSGVEVLHRYREAFPFCNGYAIVADDQGSFVVDRAFMDMQQGRRFGKIRMVSATLFWYWDTEGHSLGSGSAWKAPTQGNDVVPCLYPDSDSGESDLIPGRQHDKVGYVTREGAFQALAWASFVHEFHDGHAIVKRDVDHGAGGGFVTNTLDMPERWFDRVYHFSEGLAPVLPKAANGIRPAWHWLDVDGNLSEINIHAALRGKIEDVLPLSGGLSLVHSGGQFGYIDRAGQLRVPMRYKMAAQFSEGLASVSLDGIHYGYINMDGEPVCDFTFSGCGPCIGGFSYVSVVSLLSQNGLRRRARPDEWKIWCAASRSVIDVLGHPDSK
jgi:hypothetical protein